MGARGRAGPSPPALQDLATVPPARSESGRRGRGYRAGSLAEHSRLRGPPSCAGAAESSAGWAGRGGLGGAGRAGRGEGGEIAAGPDAGALLSCPCRAWRDGTGQPGRTRAAAACLPRTERPTVRPAFCPGDCSQDGPEGDRGHLRAQPVGPGLRGQFAKDFKE